MGDEVVGRYGDRWILYFMPWPRTQIYHISDVETPCKGKRAGR
jgi:hypothetical protein